MSDFDFCRHLFIWHSRSVNTPSTVSLVCCHVPRATRHSNLHFLRRSESIGKLSEPSETGLISNEFSYEGAQVVSVFSHSGGMRVTDQC